MVEIGFALNHSCIDENNGDVYIEVFKQGPTSLTVQVSLTVTSNTTGKLLKYTSTGDLLLAFSQ